MPTGLESMFFLSRDFSGVDLKINSSRVKLPGEEVVRIFLETTKESQQRVEFRVIIIYKFVLQF
jgi:hypothetical protein